MLVNYKNKYLFYPLSLEQKLQQIKLLILDVDGILTDGQLYYGNSGEELKAFNTLDGHGLKLLLKNGINVAIISGRGSQMLIKRLTDLGVTDIYQNIHDKMTSYNELLLKYNLQARQVAYMGDDTPDYTPLITSGLSACPQNAHSLIKSACTWNIALYGGNGAVRALADAILVAQFGIGSLLV
jgi:3-deoxy-D-manno-octulosonate 8-phosphate phosphatase (KDO 8-P phosphatase)